MMYFLSSLMSLVALAVFSTAASQSGYISREHPDQVAELLVRVKEGAKQLNLTGEKLGDACWKDSYGRGVGRPIHACRPDQEKDGLLCYPWCREGYDGVGPVCWEECKPGFTDTGAFCGKSGEIISADNDDCPWYDICGLTFEKGCSSCPDGYKNDGCTCRIDPVTYAKDSYGRGVGEPLGCSEDEEYDAGLCYDPCRENYDGVGPVCWEYCPRARPVDYGAVCCESTEACNDFIKDVSMGMLSAIASAIEALLMPWDLPEHLQDAIMAIASAFILPSCQMFTNHG